MRLGLCISPLLTLSELIFKVSHVPTTLIEVFHFIWIFRLFVVSLYNQIINYVTNYFNVPPCRAHLYYPVGLDTQELFRKKGRVWYQTLPMEYNLMASCYVFGLPRL